MYKYLIFFILLAPATGDACSLACPEINSHYKSAEYLFVGKVTRLEEYGINWFQDEPKIKVYFDILKNWKGDWGNRPLKTTYNKYSCWGYYFSKDETYIIFLTNDEFFSLCDAMPYAAKLETEIDEIHRNQ